MLQNFRSVCPDLFNNTGNVLLKKCLYQRGIRIREVSVLDRYLQQRDVVLEVSVLERCLYQRDVCIREVSILERCLDQRSVCIREMSYQRGVCIREMSVLKRCLYQRDVCLREVSVLERCLWIKSFVRSIDVVHSTKQLFSIATQTYTKLS